MLTEAPVAFTMTAAYDDLDQVVTDTAACLYLRRWCWPAG
jgi:hypothetical protein